VESVLQLNVNVLAMSATLTLDHIDDLQDVLEMHDAKIVNQGTDRPNLHLRVLPMRHTASTFMDLLYAMPELRASSGYSLARLFPRLHRSTL
jgi:superfamily II DNA helicase RecQ